MRVEEVRYLDGFPPGLARSPRASAAAREQADQAVERFRRARREEGLPPAVHAYFQQAPWFNLEDATLISASVAERELQAEAFYATRNEIKASRRSIAEIRRRLPSRATAAIPIGIQPLRGPLSGRTRRVRRTRGRGALSRGVYVAPEVWDAAMTAPGDALQT